MCTTALPVLHQKRLIDVFGKSNTGKTSTLNALIGKLLADPSFTLIDPVSKNDVYDRVIGRMNGLTIGVITFGDPGYDAEVKSFLNGPCIHYGCDVIFTASRTFGGVYNVERAFAAANNYHFIETSPLYMPTTPGPGSLFAPLHDIFADMLFKLI